MGRAKLNMEFITKEKTRATTFHKRKKGLIRKLDELTTLCDVSACIIICGRKDDTGCSEPDVWPADRDEVLRVIRSYLDKNKDSAAKTYGLSDFWHDRLGRAEEELVKERKKSMEAKYPTWIDFMNHMPESRLRDFAAALARKSEDVRSRIEALRAAKHGLNTGFCYPHAGLNTDQAQPFGFGQANGLVQYPMMDPLKMLVMNREYNDPCTREYKPFNDRLSFCSDPVQGMAAESCYMPAGPVSLPPLPPSDWFGQEGFESWCHMNYGRGRFY